MRADELFVEQINARFIAHRAELLLAAPLDSAARAELIFP